MPPIAKAKSPLKEERKERLGVNLFDIEKCGEVLIGKILGGKIGSEVIVFSPEKEDEVIVSLTCGVETGALAIDVLRSESRRLHLLPIRVYMNRGSTWVKVPLDAVLTIEYKGRHILNPKYFPKFESSLEGAPLSAEPINFGGG